MADRDEIRIRTRISSEFKKANELTDKLKQKYPDRGVNALRMSALIVGLESLLSDAEPISSVESKLDHLLRVITGVTVETEITQEIIKTFMLMYTSRNFSKDKDSSQEMLKMFLSRDPVQNPFKIGGVEKYRKGKYEKK